MAEGRDWVEVVGLGACPDCGFDAHAPVRGALGSAARHYGGRWRAWLEAIGPDSTRLRARPQPDVWSALEYAAHVRDLLDVQTTRVARMLAEDHPELGWWDHDAAVTREAYNTQSAEAVVAALSDNADRLAADLEDVADAGWPRVGMRRHGERFTVEGLVRFTLHELAHHLADADHSLTRARPPRDPRRRGVDRVVLEGSLVRLEPLSRSHVRELVAASSGDRSSFGFSATPEGWDSALDYVEVALAAEQLGDQLPFATVSLPEGRVVGSTRFCRMETWDWPAGNPLQRREVPDVVEIGYTWLAPNAQGTGINREAKLLMLIHAFEVWKVHRVAWRTDKRNERSRRAIEALGATYEGMRRAERPGVDGTVRDSIFFSITSNEWPDAKRVLASRIAAPMAGAGC